MLREGLTDHSGLLSSSLPRPLAPLAHHCACGWNSWGLAPGWPGSPGDILGRCHTGNCVALVV